MRTKAAVATAVVMLGALALASIDHAAADSPGPRPFDVVGVGSDTLQDLADFLFDGAPGAVNGYNAQLNVNRVYGVFSTGDVNGRATYDGTCGAATSTGVSASCSTTTKQAPNALPVSVILRAGTKPVVRPNGNGAAIAALVQDTPGDPSAFPGYQGLLQGSIDFAAVSRLPNSSEIDTCPTTSACGGLHVYRAATDQLAIVTSNIAGAMYEGPAGLSAKELVDIYSCAKTSWIQLPGNTSGSSATIHPLIPQSGSSTREFFLADLQAANGGSPVALGSCVRTVQENDPTGVYADSAPGDAIEPFSAGKVALINSGYFASGAGYQGSSGTNAYSANQLKLLTGGPGDADPIYGSRRGLYFVIRNSELTSRDKAQPGSTLNWAQTLFAGPSSWIGRTSQAGAVQAAGFTQAYKDCGVNPAAC